MFKVIFTKRAYEDLSELKAEGYGERARDLKDAAERNPFEPMLNFAKLQGTTGTWYSLRVSVKHRFIYQILPNAGGLADDRGVPYDGVVHVLQMRLEEQP